MTGPNSYSADNKRKGQHVIGLDCRGLEFIEFKADVRLASFSLLTRLTGLQGEWEAKGTESSTPFTGIDLLEGEWYDYDEKAGEEVSIKEINWEMGRA